MTLFKKMIYFDNSATSFKKPLCVRRTVAKSLKASGNSGRGGNLASNSALLCVFETRKLLNQTFNGYGESYCIFTENCTEALNVAIIGSNLNNCHVLTSIHAHNSVLRPLEYLQDKKQITYSVFTPKSLLKTTLSDVKENIKPNTKMLVLAHISNVLGAEAEIEKIGAFCKQNNIIFVVDGAQSGGHKKIDMQKFGIDFLCLAGHKGLLAMPGASPMLFNPKYTPKPIKFGGTGTNSASLKQNFSSPEVFESGTKSLPAIASLKSGVNYVNKNFDKINSKIKNLTIYAKQKLQNISTVISQSNNGIILFNVGKINSSEVGNYLNKHKICVRCGLHCAPLVHKTIGTLNQGAVRVSFSHYNTKQEINKLAKAIKKLSQS